MLRASVLTLTLIVIILGSVSLLTAGVPADKQGLPLWTPSDGPNAPMGEAKGIFSGRVVWDRDLRATPWDGKTGHWWEDATGIDGTVVARMFSESLKTLSGAKSDGSVWEALLRHFNRTHGRGDHAYVKGEKIAIKINCNNAYEGYGDSDNQIDASPQTVYALLDQLVNVAGVPQELISVYEATRVIPDRVFNKSHAAFPNVRFIDSQGNGTNGRFPVEYQKNVLRYSVEQSHVGVDLPKCVTEATYLVNMALMKGHPTTGMTLTAKNHYGTVDVRDHEIFVNSHSHPMGIYHPFVDMIGSKELGQKTVLFILDGLYGIRDVNDDVAEHGHWDTLFKGEWLASLFFSQDPIALDSVGLDFIRAEFPWGRGNTPQALTNSDNYMHEAAQADHPPSGTRYAPDGQPLTSLGVHEHWNNPADRQYSRNLGQKKGIELVRLPPASAGTFPWSKAVADTFIKRFPDPDSIHWVNQTNHFSWQAGYAMFTMEKLWRLTGERRYFDYIQRYVDQQVDENGNIPDFVPTALDNFLPGYAILFMYEQTKQEKYRIAATKIRDGFREYPRNADGSFWHGAWAKHQLWVDGVFMGQMFLARYGAVVGDRDYAFGEVTTQMKLALAHCRKPNGLLLHGWDESRAASWADKRTGLAPEVWSEGLGWYALLMADVFDYLPKDHPDRPYLLDALRRLCKGLKEVQDPKTGMWYQVVDKPKEPGNWNETSGTGMFTYLIRKSIDKGYIGSKDYLPVVRKAYAGIVTKAVTGTDGLIDIRDCSSIGIMDNYQAYITSPKEVNPFAGVTSFILGTSSMERP